MREGDLCGRVTRLGQHCATCTCGCTCGYGGQHDDANSRCELNYQRVGLVLDGEKPDGA